MSNISNKETILPHGGVLVNCFAREDQLESLQETCRTIPSLKVSRRVLCDLEMLAIGAFSPFKGFVGKKDYDSIINNMRLTSGIVWTIPITLQIKEEEYKELKNKKRIALKNEKSEIVAVLNVEEVYKVDLEQEALQVYKTTDVKHPAVKYLFNAGEYCISGEVEVLKHTLDEFLDYNLGCAKTRMVFKEKKWKRVVAFQTRNPVHRAHEYLLKVALEVVDGLLLHPTMGETKDDDIPQDVRMRCYETILQKYFPRERTLLVVMPASMRYGGPREAVLHAIIRKNYGCTHFIVGRDHAGVGNYYGTYDAQKIFDEFKPEEIGITPLFFEHTFYCRGCEGMSSYKTCPHDASHHLILSGTKVREMLKKGEMLPEEFTRPEIAKILIESMRAVGASR